MEFRSVVALSEFEDGRRPRKEDEMLFPGLNHGLELSQPFHFSNAGALAENRRWAAGTCFSVRESVPHLRSDAIAGGGWQCYGGMTAVVCRYAMAHGWRWVANGSATDERIFGIFGDARQVEC